jgi:hypothetical protein
MHEREYGQFGRRVLKRSSGYRLSKTRRFCPSDSKASFEIRLELMEPLLGGYQAALKLRIPAA